MKINYSNKIYIQVIDLMRLSSFNIDMPGIVRKSIFNISYKLMERTVKGWAMI